MKVAKKVTLFFIILCISGLVLIAQPKKQLINVLVTPTKTTWNYTLDEQANFEVKILKNGQLLPNTKIHYRLGMEQMPSLKSGDLNLENGSIVIEGVKMSEPGFLRCEVSINYEDQEYYGMGTAGFAVDKIKPTVKMPDDFNEFWAIAKDELADIPIDAIVTLVPELCTSEINVFHVNLQNIKMPDSWSGVSRFYGMLSVPKKSGKYPAILGVPGAGVRSYGRDERAAKGIIVFKVGIHGIPVNMLNEKYLALATGALSGYYNYNLGDKDKYYYKRVYLGCVRAIDYIFSLPEFDGENLAVTGGSQGGALSIVTAGLDDRVKYIAAFYPALCDLTGYLHGRAGGWPHMFKHFDKENHPNWVNATAYYDVVNFSRKLTVPGWYSWGFNDNVCPPTSMHAAYNAITAPKELHNSLETGHWRYPEQQDEANNWLFEKLNK